MKKKNSLILSDLKKLLKNRFGENLFHLILFGSQMEGKANKYSDYDILIILKESFDWKIEREISDICSEIDLKYDLIIDFHVLCVHDLSTLRGRQPIFVNAISNGIYA